jgi:hypothetical protein
LVVVGLLQLHRFLEATEQTLFLQTLLPLVEVEDPPRLPLLREMAVLEVGQNGQELQQVEKEFNQILMLDLDTDLMVVQEMD